MAGLLVSNCSAKELIGISEATETTERSKRDFISDGRLLNLTLQTLYR